MSRKKKVFIVVYVIALLAIITLLLNKIIAAENSTKRSQGTNDTGTFVGIKLDGKETEATINPANIDVVDFGNTTEEAVLNWAKGEITWNLLIENDDVFCLDKTKRMLNRNNVENQYIRKVTSVDMVGHKEGVDFATVPISCTVWPENGSWRSASIIPPATYASLIFDWSKLAVRHQTQDDFGMDAAYVFAHRNEYTNKSDGTYTDAQHALWAVLKGENAASGVDSDVNDDNIQTLKTIKELNKQIEELNKQIEAINTNISNCEREINTRQNNIDECNDRIMQLEEEKRNASAYRQEEIQRQIESYETRILNYETQISNYEDQILGYETEIDNKKEEIRNKQDQIQEQRDLLANVSGANGLIIKAFAFKQYRDDFKVPSLVDSNGKYEFKYVKNGDYFITGPVSVNYTSLKTNAEEIVGQITSTILTGKNNSEQDVQLESGKDYDIVDENGEIINLSSESENESVISGNLDFYIRIKNDAVKRNEIRYITDFTMKFKYMNITADGYKIYDGGSGNDRVLKYYQWIRDWREVSFSDDCSIYCSECERERGIYCYDSSDRYANCPYCGKGNCYIYHSHDTEYQLKRNARHSSSAELQPIFICGNAEIFWEEYELNIKFKPDGGLPTFIDLGGKVWVDNPMDNGKVIDEADGIFNNGEWGRENVLVELFFFDKTPVKVGVKDVIADKRNTKLINGANGNYAVYTDSNGDYMFYGLPVDQNYYIQFTYDGQTYTITKYLAEDGDENKYKEDPNQEKYDNNSKVKGETDRQGFNNRFEKITYANIRTRGTGKASGTTTPLSYIFDTYKEEEASYIKSKIITTDKREDANYGETGTPKGPDKQTGKTIDPHKIQARTPESLKYPFEKNGEILIYSSEIKYTKLEGNALHYLRHINLGLKFRPRADFQLSTQLKAGATTIKDKEKVVIYPQSATKANLDKDMDFTRQEDEYIKQEISAADYNWAARFREIYGENGQEITGYVVDENKLHVYVLYRIAIKNQCEDANDYGVINEIIDYYDNRLERVQYNDLAISTRLFREAGIPVPIDAGESWIDGTNTEVKWTSSSTVGNYQMMKSTTPITIDKGNSETAIYLILKVKDNGAVLYQGGDENDKNDGMQNIAEIGSYSVYNNGVNVGKIDKDSAPGNATPGDRKTYEDDTDASPMFKLVINWTPKEIEGTVWDDSTDYGNVDGTLESAERRFSGVEGVTVKLVEHIIQEDGSVKEVERPGLEIRNNQIYVDPEQSVITGKYGKYSFYVEGGNYSLKFVYGDQEMLRTNKTHNAQDYQALNYSDYKALSSGEVNGYNQSDKLKAFATNEDLVKGVKNFLVVGQEGENSDLDWWNTNWNIGAIFGPTGIGSQSKKENEGVISTSNSVSSVRDKAEIRADIIENTQNLTYYNASKLDELNGTGGVSLNTARFLSGENTSEPRHTYTSDGNYTYMEAVSDIITIASNDLITEPNVINLGLKQRPTASRKLEKRVDRIILTASDGTVLVDTDDNTKQSGLAKIDDIQQTFINLEPGLMDGALLDIYYTLTVTNDSGANDCLQNYVYVRGNVRTGHLQNNDHEVMENLGFFLGGYGLTTPLPIKAEIFDYVNINLEYRADDNKYEKGEIWDRVYEESGNTGNSVNRIEDGWLSESAGDGIERSVKKVSKVLQTNTDKVVSKYKGDRVSGDATDGLLAGESVNIPIHLGITLSEDTSKMNLMDYDFSNCAELVKITTTAGRRDYETIPGDYVPYDTSEANKKQQDAFLTGSTLITPPLGEGRFYYVITIVSASIILVGIVLIKKKVLKK